MRSIRQLEVRKIVTMNQDVMPLNFLRVAAIAVQHVAAQRRRAALLNGSMTFSCERLR